MHRGEYVIPAPVVRATPNLVGLLEGLRLRRLAPEKVEQVVRLIRETVQVGLPTPTPVSAGGFQQGGLVGQAPAGETHYHFDIHLYQPVVDNRAFWESITRDTILPTIRKTMNEEA